jgi:PAS domain S-box-containing protein
MSIRTKTLVLIAATTAVLVIILYSLFLLIVLGRFARLERLEAERSAEQALNALNDEQVELDAFNNDWAAWDDTYAFVASGNERYAASNLVDETFLNARLNFMVFLDDGNRVVYARGFDYHLGQEVPLPPALLELLLGPVRAGGQGESERVRSGLLLLPLDPALLSYRPILTSSGDGPARGTLLMGRYLDWEEIQRLGARTRLSLQLFRLDEQPPKDLARVLPLLSEAAPRPMAHPLDASRIAAYLRIDDIEGRPALALRVDQPREVYRQGLIAVRYLVISLIAVGSIFAAGIMVLIERSILGRLFSLGAGVSTIGEHRDLGKRLAVKGRDELSRLATSINEMLGRLQQAEEKHRALSAAVPDLIMRIDRQGKVLDSNGRSQVLGLEAEGMIGRNLGELLGPELAWRCLEAIRDALRSGVVQVFEHRYSGPAGSRDIEVRTVAIGPTEVLQIARDITERKQAEETQKKDVLLREIHHRIKNNLQVISSLLYLQSQQEGDPRVARIFEENRNRVHAIALIHEKLYQVHDSGGIRFAGYLRDLTNNLFIAYGKGSAQIRLALKIEDQLVLGMNSAILCGMLVHELVSNALQHGFPGGRAGQIGVEMEEWRNRRFCLTVSDDGIGFPEGFDLESSSSMGLMLVRLFARQLEAHLELERDGGTRFVISFTEHE